MSSPKNAITLIHYCVASIFPVHLIIYKRALQWRFFEDNKINKQNPQTILNDLEDYHLINIYDPRERFLQANYDSIVGVRV